VDPKTGQTGAILWKPKKKEPLGPIATGDPSLPNITLSEKSPWRTWYNSSAGYSRALNQLDEAERTAPQGASVANTSSGRTHQSACGRSSC